MQNELASSTPHNRYNTTYSNLEQKDKSIKDEKLNKTQRTIKDLSGKINKEAEEQQFCATLYEIEKKLAKLDEYDWVVRKMDPSQAEKRFDELIEKVGN